MTGMLQLYVCIVTWFCCVYLCAILLSLRKVLVFEDPWGPVYKSTLSLSLELNSLFLTLSSNHNSLSLDHKVLKNCWGLCILQTVRYVSREVSKFDYRHRVWGYCEKLLTYWYQILLTGKPFFTVTMCCCPWGKSLSSRILADQFTSPCPRIISPRVCLRPQVLVLVLER